jgi:hypothetical protein
VLIITSYPSLKIKKKLANNHAPTIDAHPHRFSWAAQLIPNCDQSPNERPFAWGFLPPQQHRLDSDRNNHHFINFFGNYLHQLRVLHKTKLFPNPNPGTLPGNFPLGHIFNYPVYSIHSRSPTRPGPNRGYFPGPTSKSNFFQSDNHGLQKPDSGPICDPDYLYLSAMEMVKRVPAQMAATPFDVEIYCQANNRSFQFPEKFGSGLRVLFDNFLDLPWSGQR